MIGDSRSRNGDPIANLKSAFEPRAHFQNNARSGITEGQWLVETRSHSIQSGQEAIAMDLGYYLLDQIRPTLCFRDQALFCKFDDHSLCASGNQAGCSANQEMARFDARYRYVANRQGASACTLDDLFHPRALQPGPLRRRPGAQSCD